MEARAESGREALKQPGLNIDAEAIHVSGLRVVAVEPSSEAAVGGLQAGDVIVSFDGVQVSSVADIAPRRGARLAEVGLERDSTPLVRTVSVAKLDPGGLPADLLAALMVLAIAAGVLPLSFPAFALTGLWVLGTSSTAQRGEGGLLESVPAIIGQQIQLGVSLVTLALWFWLLVHFIRRVRFNHKSSKQPLHLNPFI